MLRSLSTRSATCGPQEDPLGHDGVEAYASSIQKGGIPLRENVPFGEGTWTGTGAELDKGGIDA